eukprot:9079850-Alexandrium_andersonii.AAC.1
MALGREGLSPPSSRGWTGFFAFPGRPRRPLVSVPPGWSSTCSAGSWAAGPPPLSGPVGPGRAVA